MEPIKTEYISIKKNSLTQNRLLAAIDSGCSLTKLLFLNRNHKDQFFDDNTANLTLEFSLFDNRHFEDALEYLKSNAYQLDSNDYKIHITGATTNKYRKKIEEILKKETTFIDEFLTISNGHKFALENIGIEKLITPAVTVNGYGKLDSSTMEKFFESVNKKFQSNKIRDPLSNFPSLFHVHGSGAGCFYFDENGKPEFYGNITPGGKTFLGLAKCLLDTNDYSEVMELASRGTRTTVDTMVSEMFDGQKDSPYGKLPPGLPMFPFGQCGDYDKGMETLKKEDVALSLVATHGQWIIGLCSQVAMIKKISKVYLSGNIFISNLFEKEIRQFLSIFPFGIELHFLNFGYFGVLGALFSDCDEQFPW